MRKTLYTLLAVMAAVMNASAADSYQYHILHEVDTVVKAKLGGISLGDRAIHHIVYEFPTTDTDGMAVTVSGVVMIPQDIINGKVPCDGIVLYNHHTVGSPEDVPSAGGLDAESGILANPLKPNYIVVACDYIGYGSSSDHPIAYLCGDTNAHNILDGLLSARQMMDDKQIPQGKYLFNMGYSQGGTESMYVAKVRDMEYRDKVTFTKTFAGGGVMDCEKAYEEFVKGDAWDSLKDVAMMLISVNENYHLGWDYHNVFCEPLASSIAKVVKSKDKGDLNMEGIDSLHQMLQPAYLMEDTEEYQQLRRKLADIKITNGWEPDTTQNYYYEHSRHDNYVPIQCGRSIIPWMAERGFKPSLVPGKTRLQTSMLVFKLKHQQAAIIWVIQTMAAIQYWPTVYYDGEQNTYYHNVVHDLNLMKTVKLLEVLGLNLRKMVSSNSARRAPLRRADFLSELNKVLGSLGLTLADALEMLSDSGVTLFDVLEVYQYLTSSAASGYDGMQLLEERTEAPLYLMRHYEETLAKWFLLGGYDAAYDRWGW